MKQLSAGRSFAAPLTAALLSAAILAPQVQAQPQDAPETKEQRDARMAWWREAKFGMFIHWGVYAVPAGFYKDKPIGGIGEWIMNRGKIPVAEYQPFAKGFTAAKYDADAWVKLAKDAGMKYVVITSKHHDGFTLFPSKASAWGVGQSAANRDLLQPLAEACRKYGLKLGFYYSQAQDWNNPGGAAAGGHWDKAQDGDMDAYIKNVAVPQVREILSNYGPDFPAVLWWDTPTGMNKERADALYKAVKELKPNIIMNNRLGGGYQGDTETPEQFIPATGFKGRDWETCMTLNNTWGFKKDDHAWKSTETLIRNLIDIVSKGGNYLLNVGPTAEGEIPAPSINSLKEVGAWMKSNSAAIYGTTASPFKKLTWGRATTKRDGASTTLYLHVFNWPEDGKLLVPGLNNEVLGANLLSDATKVAFAKTEGGVALSLPATAPDKISTTIALKIKGEPDVTAPIPVPPTQKADGTLTFDVAEAVLHGDTIKVENAQRKNNIGFWTEAADWLEWPFVATKPGKYVLSAEVASTGSGSAEVILGDQKVRFSSPNTGDYNKYQKATLGTIEIAAPGKLTLQLKPVAGAWKPFNLRNIELKPAP